MNVRKLPAQEPRMETGVVQFGEDWPGVFIRGDNALHFAMALRQTLDSAADSIDGLSGLTLNSMADLLVSCDARTQQQQAGVVYTGSRGPNGAAVFKLVDGVPESLPLYLDHVNHSPTGFEWGYSGSGPAQLAYAVLFDATQDRPLATRLHQLFKAEVIAPVQGVVLTLTQDDVLAWVSLHRGEAS